MANRNEAKYETLTYIDEVGLATAKEIAEYRGVTHGCQSTLMSRYWRYGLLNRCTGEGKEKYYSLSDRGYERLDWLESEFEDVYVTFSGITVKRCRIKREEDTINLLSKITRCKVIRVDEDYIDIERNPD